MPSKTAEIKITKVEHDVDRHFYRFHTDHPQVKRLDIQDDRPEAKGLYDQAVTIGRAGTSVVAEYNEAKRTLDDGRSFTNYYAVNFHAQPEAEAAPGFVEEVTRGATQAATNPEAARRMATSTALKLAVQSRIAASERAVATMPLMPAEQRTFDVQKTIGAAWDEWQLDVQEERLQTLIDRILELRTLGDELVGAGVLEDGDEIPF